MSTLSVQALPTTPSKKPSETPSTPERGLRALPKPVVRRKPRLMHGVVALSGLGIIMGGQLGLSIALSDGAYTVSSLSATASDLGRTEQALQERLDVLSSPQQIALGAEGLGMVAGQSSQFLQLSNGQVLGGPDALHMQQPSTYLDGTLLVANGLVATEPVVPVAPPEPAAEPAPYPGMLLPAEGVATG